MEACNAGACQASRCTPGAHEDCYTGPESTKNVGACHGGQRTCETSGDWGACAGELLPVAEICGNAIDENCSGQADEDEDQDGDGFSTCEGDCCDTTADCGSPNLVNPGAFDASGNNVDDDCDGTIDNVTAADCDTGLASNSSDPMDYAKALDLCRTATETDGRWGVISANWSLADGTLTPALDSRSIRAAFGANVTPRGGHALAEISSGKAADADDSNPSYDAAWSSPMSTVSGCPADWVAAHNGSLPNAPGCQAPASGTANDSVMLTLRVRVPTNAQSFSLSTNFFSSEYPEWVCSAYNDFFVVLLDSTWTGTPANPGDKNLATYTAANGMKYPVGVNLAKDDTGLFNQCVNGHTGCRTSTLPPTTLCQSTEQLAGTGLDTAAAGSCDADSLTGGGTGWLTTSGNVVGGEIITLRIAIWDTSDANLDSLAVIDNFKWAVTASEPGTIVD